MAQPLDQAQIDGLPESARVLIGFAGDGILGGGAIAAWLLEIEHVLGGIGAALIFGFALFAAFYRARYWRSKAMREGAAYERERDE